MAEENKSSTDRENEIQFKIIDILDDNGAEYSIHGNMLPEIDGVPVNLVLRELDSGKLEMEIRTFDDFYKPTKTITWPEPTAGFSPNGIVTTALCSVGRCSLKFLREYEAKKEIETPFREIVGQSKKIIRLVGTDRKLGIWSKDVNAKLYRPEAKMHYNEKWATESQKVAFACWLARGEEE